MRLAHWLTGEQKGKYLHPPGQRQGVRSYRIAVEFHEFWARQL